MDKKSKQTNSRVNMSQRSDYSSSRSSRSGSRAGGSLFLGSRSFVGSKTSLFSASQKNLASDSMRFQKPTAQIFDDYGVDVTPQSLLKPDQLQPALRKAQSNMFGSETGPSDTVFQQSIYGTAVSGTTFSQPFSGSMFGSLTEGSMPGSMSGSMLGSMSGDISVPSTTVPVEPTGQVQTVHLEVEPESLTEEDLDKDVVVTLSETETIWMLDIPGTCVALDSEEAEEVKKRNEEYSELVRTRPGNDRYSERGMQTIDHAPKSKHIQTDAVIKADTGVTASLWDMHDTYEALREAQAAKDEDETLEELSSRAASRMTASATSSRRSRAPTAVGITTVIMEEEENPPAGASMFTASMVTDISLHSGRSSVPVTGEEKKEVKIDFTKANDHPILKSDSLKNSLRIAERIVTQNTYQPKQALYRNLPVLLDPDHARTTSLDTLSIHAPHLEKLWDFSCPLTKKRNISSLAWNPTNKDIVAVGYGNFSASDQSVGLICCWSLKNPEYPERTFHAPSGVISLGFSNTHPNLLAAGLYNGTVALYNVRSPAHSSVLDSRDALHKHSAPVWQVGWVVKERSMGEGKAETLVSISIDGRILQWSIRKGFESSQLMKLKRMVTPKPHHDKKSTATKVKHSPSRVNPKPRASNIGQGEAYISQHGPGMGFDFWPKDPNIYLACTEEGYIHKCSCSYNEQVLETYTGHTGPVFRVRWSPFVPDIFLSCSADWTVKMWHQDYSIPLHSFRAAQKAIYDVCWSPFDSTLFGCVSDGRVEIWNLKNSVLDPLLVHKPLSAAKQTCIAFAYDTKVVLVGDSEGKVSVYSLKNIPPVPDDQVNSLYGVVNTSSIMDFSVCS